MRLHAWAGPGFRVSAAEDRFFSSPLPEATVFRFRTDYFEVESHTGAFSIKLALEGEEAYEFQRRRVTLRPGRLLLVNAGEEYASLVRGPTESLSLFIPPEDLALATKSLQATDAALLDDPASGEIPVFAQADLVFDARFDRALRRFVDASQTDSPVLRTRLDDLLLSALRLNLDTVPPGALRTLRRSTRDELVSRVLRAREYIDDRWGDVRDLDELAGVACLSRFHFLRVFREVQGESPIAYARRRRLRYAESLLKRGTDLHEVARMAGYRTTYGYLRARDKGVKRAIARGRAGD